MIPLWAGLLAVMAPAPGAAPRGNDVVYRDRGPMFSVSASPRFGILLAGGADVIQPFGFGAGLSFRVHGLRVGPIRFGAAAQLGHTRFLERRNVPSSVAGEEDQVVRRYAALGHTDFSLGPSVRLMLGPLFVTGEFGVGLGISTLLRPRGSLDNDDAQDTDYSVMIRGGGHIGVPVRNNSGVILGATVHKYFSDKQVVAELPGDPTAELGDPDTNPFDLMVEVYVGYQFHF